MHILIAGDLTPSKSNMALLNKEIAGACLDYDACVEIKVKEGIHQGGRAS